jgi:vitamin B12 transporter
MATIGISTVHEKVNSYDRINQTTVFDESTSNNALFGIWQSTIGINNLNISGRVDDYESFGTHPTGQVAWGIQPGKKSRFTASLGTAFKAPSLNELYHPGYGGFYAGNPDLKPEESITAEIGAHYSPDKQQNLGVNIYRTKVNNLIAYSGGATYNAENISEAQIDGLEFLYSFKTGPWVFNTNFTLQKAINNITKSDLLRRPRQKFNVELRHLFGTKGDLGLSWNYVGTREDFAATLDSYNLVDFSGSYLLLKSLRLEGRIENVLDEEYEHAYSYNTPGRSFYAGIRYTMGK